jgi:hypothetical protein
MGGVGGDFRLDMMVCVCAKSRVLGSKLAALLVAGGGGEIGAGGTEACTHYRDEGRSPWPQKVRRRGGGSVGPHKSSRGRRAGVRSWEAALVPVRAILLTEYPKRSAPPQQPRNSILPVVVQFSRYHCFASQRTGKTPTSTPTRPPLRAHSSPKSPTHRADDFSPPSLRHNNRTLVKN